MGFLGDVGKSIGGAINKINPFDGNDGKGLGGYAKDLGQITTSPLGPFVGDTGLSGFDLASGLLGGGGGLFGSPGSKGGGGGGGDLMAQAQMALRAAQIQADAAKYSADKQFKLGQMGIDASLQQSRNSMMGGLVAGAMAANQDTTVRKQLLPHEAGAATIMSHDLAQRWTKTLQMRTAGYTDSAINYEMGGRSWKAAFDDATWNSLKMRQDTKQDILQNVQLFGIKSASNPYGIEMSEQDWMAMHAFKNPEDVLKVDPAVAQQRNAQYEKWKSDMYASGKGMIVDIYENPQLGGSSILTMKGKDPMIDPRLKGVLQQMGDQGVGQLDSQMKQELSELDKMKPQWRQLESSSPGKGQFFDATGNMIVDQTQGGRKLSAKDQYNAQMDKYYQERKSILDRYNGLKSEGSRQKTNWDQAINALTKGERNPMTDQIEKLMKEGVIDKYGMINADKLQKFIPPELLQAPEFKLHNELSPEAQMKLKDEYKKWGEVKIDEKLIRVESMGGGVTRKMLLNPDGTKAASMLTGYAMDGMGNNLLMSIAGDRTQDFYDRASRINGMSYGPLSPGYRAPVDQNLMGGATVKKDSWNYMAKAATGQKGQPGAAQAPKTTSSNPTSSPALKLVKPSQGIAPLEAGDD